MAINAIQAAIRSMTGTERQFSGDLHAYWDQLGIPPGQFAERMVAWQTLPQNAAWLAAEAWGSDGGFVVGDLWKAGEQGIYLDASDLSTMFQDATGTTPVYAPGQGQVDPPVGRILDKSGRGNHAYQTTTTSRPTLSARYNMLTKSEDFTLGGGWSSAAGGITTTANTLTFTGQSQTVSQSVITSATPGAACTFSVDLSGAGTIYIGLARLGSGTYEQTLKKITLTELPSRYSVTHTIVNTGQAGFVAFIATATDGSARVVTAGRADLRHTADGVGLPPYQRVVDANTYDTVGFPLYLRFDGVDDWLQTGSIDFSGSDKLFLVAALRKLSDASAGCVVELGSVYTNAGAFGLLAPAGASASVALGATGSITQSAVALDLKAPISAVIAGSVDVLGDLIALRVNGAIAATKAADLGVGTLGAAVLYIGRRVGSTISFNGRLYGLLIRGGASSNAQIAAVEKLLNQKARIY